MWPKIFCSSPVPKEYGASSDLFAVSNKVVSVAIGVTKTGFELFEFRAGGSPAAGSFLLIGQKKGTKEKAAPMGWFLASRETPLPRAKKRGASQLDLARDTHHPALRDSDKGSPAAPRFLTSGQQRIGE